MGFKHEQALIGVGVQQMVNARAAGVLFTLNPITGDSAHIVVEANWGLGETVVSGTVTPDQYLVDKKLLKIVEKRVAKKTMKYVPRILGALAGFLVGLLVNRFFMLKIYIQMGPVEVGILLLVIQEFFTIIGYLEGLSRE